MNILKQNGYYLSEPEHYEDWHAGHKIEYYTFTAYYFFDNSKVFLSVKKNIKIFSKTDFVPDGFEVDYSINNRMIDFHFEKGTKYEYHSLFNIENEDIIVDEKSIKYRWTPFSKEV